MTVVQAGVMEPFENHTFQPGDALRRADLAQAVARLLPRVATAAPGAVVADRARAVPRLAETHLAYPVASVAVASTGHDPRRPAAAFEPSVPSTGAEALAVVDRLRAMAGTRR